MSRNVEKGEGTTITQPLATFCWWEKPLVVVLKHSNGIKHTKLKLPTKLLK
jgi:hypothetical protein